MACCGLIVLLSLTTNPQKHTEKSDVIVPEMGANGVKISSILQLYMYLDMFYVVFIL